MKINKFWFGFLLAFSIMLIPLAFLYADTQRVCNSIGGEVFMVALPFLVLKWREWTVEQIRKEKIKRYMHRLANNLK